MIQHPVVGGTNGDTNSRNVELNTNFPKLTPLPPPVQRYNPVNRGTTHIFYKTRMCPKFLEGNCRIGDNCTFAHGSKDLRKPPPNWQELVNGNNRAANWNEDQKIIHRMRICRKFYNGDECPYGEKCSFLHESPSKFKNEAAMETGGVRENSVINIPTLSDAGHHFSHGFAELNTPVGRIEGEHGHPSVVAKVHHGSVTDAPPSYPATAGTVQQGELKGFDKWKLAHKKLNRIYADWIDDEEDEQLSSSKMD